ncbi:SRPBCC family protein [Leptospira paudalimensis]|uniref:Polyketide cyclase n=1 Tax=Leptospira paudalimensis TaxID=2950024 RepID=A0ABT3MA88_9LEPT|nr:SRPBCC family protein [Leptospira paudalimensis]MCW7505308.1 polyketide cyclase [Leptospira paudalimensis]
MIINTYTYTTNEIKQEQIWKLMSDVNRWKNWDSTLEKSEMLGTFEAGNFFMIRPSGGPDVKIQLIEVRPNSYFKDFTKFPLAKMFGEHFYEKTSEGLKITITMSITGPLAFLWNMIVMKNIVSHLAEDVQLQINEAKKIR